MCSADPDCSTFVYADGACGLSDGAALVGVATLGSGGGASIVVYLRTNVARGKFTFHYFR